MNKFLLKLTYFSLLSTLINLSFSLKILSQSVAIHTIYEVKGKVTVNKEQWKNPQPASVGLTLKGTDKLNVEANSLVKIYCSNKTTWTVQPGNYKISDGCPSRNSVIHLPNINTRTLRNDGKTEDYLATLPYIITPRQSSILTNIPVLRWNAVEGVNTYIVKIDGVKWETETNKTEIIYSGEIPLKEGRRYRITIEADHGKSSTNDAVVGFTVLDEKTKNIVLEAKKTIEEDSLSEEEKGLILAQLYRGYELYADAIEVLEELVKQDSKLVTVYQLLGDTYFQTGLPQLAKKPYEKALQLATETKNLSVTADLQKGLGESHYSLGNEIEAKQWLEKAKTSYEELGDSSQLQAVDEIINLISGRR